MEDGKHGYNSYILFKPDYQGVPKASYRPSYSKVLWWMYRSQNKALSMFQEVGDFFIESHFYIWLVLVLIIITLKQYILKMWEKALKRKPNFEERNTEEKNFVRSLIAKWSTSSSWYNIPNTNRYDTRHLPFLEVLSNMDNQYLFKQV